MSELNDSLRRTLYLARYEASRLGLGAIDSDHLLLALSRQGDESVERVLRGVGLAPEQLRLEVEGGRTRSGPIAFAVALPMSSDCQRILELASEEALALRPRGTGAAHLFLGMMRLESCAGARLLARYGLNYEAARRELLARAATGPSEPLSELPLLARHGRDLTALAAQGVFDPLIGRARELMRLAHILCRRNKNNPILVGEPGVGKTALVEGLAQRIVEGRVPGPLRERRLICLELASIVAGTQYRGQFEERLNGILEELRQARGWIVFIDEIHTLVGAGAAEGSLDAAHILKPALSRGEISCVGATTPKEYRLHIEKDRALMRRFQPVEIAPSTPEETLEILGRIKARYEEHHQVIYTADALQAAVQQSQRYIPDRHLPDKAIDLMDEAGAWVRLEPFGDDAEGGENLSWLAGLASEEADELPRVTREHVLEVIAGTTGVPLTRLRTDESERLQRMEDKLGERVVGQQEAIAAISRAIRRARLGVRNPRRPIGSFLFVGPSGVGKTEVARRLAEFLFDSPDALVRFDMSEYMERHAVSKLIGSPPGYVGFEEGGQLTERIRRQPYSVVLFDEIEKAHPDVSNLLLQILEDGRLTDSVGNQVNFANTVLLMTSNVGSRLLVDRDRRLGFGSSPAGRGLDRGLEEEIRTQLARAFSPEFLNRLDGVILFKALDSPELAAIVDLMLADLNVMLADSGVRVVVSPEARQWLLAEAGVDPATGARHLRRTIQRWVEDPISEILISSPGEPQPWIGAVVRDGRLELEPAREEPCFPGLEGDGAGFGEVAGGLSNPG